MAASTANARGMEDPGWDERKYDAERGCQADLLRCLFVPSPFHLPLTEPAWLVWKGGALIRLAQAAYDDRQLPAGTLDGSRLAVLADALEEAGLTDPALLGHLRSPGPHVRGCHVLDWLLGRE